MARSPTTTEERALALLGSGVTPEQVASAVGVTVSRISQLLSDPDFASQVAELRFHNLSQHNERDSRYDKLEDSLIDKIEDLMPMMMRPLEVLKAIQIVNSAKRRGQSAPEQVTAQQTVVSITMPSVVVNRFVTNINNQVIQAGDQQLLTIQSGSLLKEAQAAQLQRGLQNGTHTRTAEIAAPTRDSQERSNLPVATQQAEGRSYPPSSFVPA